MIWGWLPADTSLGNWHHQEMPEILLQECSLPVSDHLIKNQGAPPVSKEPQKLGHEYYIQNLTY